MWIFYLYFSELYFGCYVFYHFIVFSACFNSWYILSCALGTHGPQQHRVTANGPGATLAGHVGSRPTRQFNLGQTARARVTAAMTGDGEHAYVDDSGREEARRRGLHVPTAATSIRRLYQMGSPESLKHSNGAAAVLRPFDQFDDQAS